MWYSLDELFAGQPWACHLHSFPAKTQRSVRHERQTLKWGMRLCDEGCMTVGEAVLAQSISEGLEMDRQSGSWSANNKGNDGKWGWLSGTSTMLTSTNTSGDQTKHNFNLIQVVCLIMFAWMWLSCTHKHIRETDDASYDKVEAWLIKSMWTHRVIELLYCGTVQYFNAN